MQGLENLFQIGLITKNPRIVDANITIKNGDICIEKYPCCL